MLSIFEWSLKKDFTVSISHKLIVNEKGRVGLSK